MSNIERTQPIFSDDLAQGYERIPAAPCADDGSITVRSGVLDQRIAQGQAQALDLTDELITIIKERAVSGNLNRGLTLDLPYFDSKQHRIETRKFEIIPVGRVMFVPAFVVLAADREEIKVRKDKRLDSSTRDHLLDLLERYRQAFEIS